MEQNAVRLIKLPQGGTLHLTPTDAFYEAVRRQFDLKADEHVDDDHVRMFIHGAVKTAIDRCDSDR